MKLILVDDHAVLRQGLRSFLEQQEGVEVVGEAETGREALRLAERQRPDVVVMDIGMRDMNGLEATRQMKRIDPDIRVVALSMYSDEQYVKGIFDAGGKGYVLKTCEAAEVLRAIDAVRRGRTYITPEVTHIMVHPTETGAGHPDGVGSPSPDVLTAREREVLQLIAEGFTSKEIAFKLDMAVKTVETHRAHLMHKLNLHNVAGLTKYAVRQGITSLEG